LFAVIVQPLLPPMVAVLTKIPLILCADSRDFLLKASHAFADGAVVHKIEIIPLKSLRVLKILTGACFHASPNHEAFCRPREKTLRKFLPGHDELRITGAFLFWLFPKYTETSTAQGRLRRPDESVV